MRMRLRGWLVAMLLFMSGKHASAAAGATAAAGAFAIGAGMDPWPWILGGMGCTVVYAYKPPQTRPIALANAMVSLFAGGVGAPYAAKLLHGYGAGDWANVYVLAFLLAAGWPWLAPLALEKLRSVMGALQFGKGAKNVE